MARKRIKDKKKKYLKYRILTDDLLEVICDGYIILNRSDIDIDLTDKKLVKKIWDLHKEKVMKIWSQDPKGKAGRRPKFWWLVEASEHRKRLGNKIETQYSYLKRLNLLEDWEIEEYKRLREVFGKGNIYEREWEY